MERQLDVAAEAAAGSSELAVEFDAAVQSQTEEVMDDMMDSLRWWYAGEVGPHANSLFTVTDTLLHCCQGLTLVRFSAQPEGYVG